MDRNNCGDCGKACPFDFYCIGGTCAFVCAVPNRVCPNAAGGVACVDTFNDPNNCGGCGIVCPRGAFCCGACVTNNDMHCGGCAPCNLGDVCSQTSDTNGMSFICLGG